MSVEAAERYVAAGAALLDEKGPEGWRETLYAARDRLNVHSVYDCPLGILYGHYEDGVMALETLRTAHTGRYGFDSFYGDEDFDDEEEDYASAAEVRDAWLDEIEPEVNDGAPV